MESNFFREKKTKLLFYMKKKKHKIDEIINVIKKEGIEIVDISTDDGDLEDVFLQLTKN